MKGTRVDSKNISVGGEQVFRFENAMCTLTYASGYKVELVRSSGTNTYLGKWKKDGWAYDLKIDRAQWRASLGEVAISWTQTTAAHADYEQYNGVEGHEFLQAIFDASSANVATRLRLLDQAAIKLRVAAYGIFPDTEVASELAKIRHEQVQTETNGTDRPQGDGRQGV